MAKKKGKRVDPEKKAVLQAKKEAKAEKSALKRLAKESSSSLARESADNDVATGAPPILDSFEDLLLAYKRQDEIQQQISTSKVESIEGFPQARANCTLVVTEDTKKKNAEVYLFGGEYYDGLENVVLNHLFKCDLSTLQWRRIYTAVAPPPRCAHSCVYYNHALYVLGGELATADHYHHYKDLWRFDCNKMTWQEIVPSKNLGTAPSARSGHAAVVWKHYMIVFGGFYEAMRDVPRWYNDVTVFDLQTEQWMDIPHSKLAQRPEPRSACNVALLSEDRLLVHGGFSKLSKGSGGASQIISSRSGARSHARHHYQQSNNDDAEEDSIQTEVKVHTDAWILHLKPLLGGKPPTWERWMSSISMKSSSESKINQQGRSGTSCASFKDRLVCMGGVLDTYHHHHKVESVFFNDVHSLDVERRKWFPVVIRPPSDGDKSRKSSQRRRVKDDERIDEEAEDAKEEIAEDEYVDDDDDDNLDLKEEGSGVIGVMEESESAWDLEKIRANMFAFIDGQGRVVYEKIEADSDDEESGGEVARKNSSNLSLKNDEEDVRIGHESNQNTDFHRQMEGSDYGALSNTNQKPLHRPKGSNVAAAASCLANITSSSVMELNPETKIPEAVMRSEPLPRINASAWVTGNTMYVYGGLLEVGDREVTLDDMWSLDLKKRDQWKCLWPGTMHKQVWKGASLDDDDSYYSTEQTTVAGEGDADTINDDDEDDDQGKSEGLASTHATEIARLKEQYELGNPERTPVPTESLSEFYARTASYWNVLSANRLGLVTSDADDAGNAGSSKEVKREAFVLARERYEELEPVMERLKKLECR